MNKIITVAGATGNLGFRIVKALRKHNAIVKALVRVNTSTEKINEIEKTGAEIIIIQDWNETNLAAACKGSTCVVSVLAGLEDVIIDAQTILLNAAIAAGVPRFIPSDYSLNFTGFKDGENRNLDLRRKFHQVLDASNIEATSIFNGAFMELLTGDMPMIFFKPKRVLHWGNPHHALAFTTMDNTAEYTAHAALDDDAPRYLNIAGDQISPLEIKNTLGNIEAKKYSIIRAGGAGLLSILIKVAKVFSPGKTELYPAWQGMQYMHNMIDVRANIKQLDNDRYPGIKWTTVKELLEAHLKTQK